MVRYTRIRTDTPLTLGLLGSPAGHHKEISILGIPSDAPIPTCTAPHSPRSVDRDLTTTYYLPNPAIRLNIPNPTSPARVAPRRCEPRREPINTHNIIILTASTPPSNTHSRRDHCIVISLFPPTKERNPYPSHYPPRPHSHS